LEVGRAEARHLAAREAGKRAACVRMADAVVLLLAIGGEKDARKPKEEGKNRVPAFRRVVSETGHLLE